MSEMVRDEIWFNPELNEWHVRYLKVIRGKEYGTIGVVRNPMEVRPTASQLADKDRLAAIAFERAERLDFPGSE